MPQPTCHGKRTTPTSHRLWARLATFAVLAIVVIGIAAWQLRPQRSTGTADRTVTVTMAGFEPSSLTVPANQATTVLLKNPDSPYHNDGGGVHEFAIPELGIDVKIDPRNSVIATIPTTAPGTYTFYCDTCCGGKANPSMRGTLVVS